MKVARRNGVLVALSIAMGAVLFVGLTAGAGPPPPILGTPIFGHNPYNPVFPAQGGTDRFHSIATVGLQKPCNGPVKTVDLVGPTTVQRGSMQADGQNHAFFDTEMLQLDLKGSDPQLGPVTIRESPTLQSGGKTTADMPGGTHFPAESFFDIFIEIQFGNGPMLHADDPFRVQTRIWQLPPIDSVFQRTNEQKVQLRDPQNKVKGCLLFVSHIPTTPTSATLKRELILLEAAAARMEKALGRIERKL